MGKTDFEKRVIEVDQQLWSDPAGPVEKLAKTLEEIDELMEAAAEYELDPNVDTQRDFAYEIADVAITLIAVAGRLGFSLQDLMWRKWMTVEGKIDAKDPRILNNLPYRLCPKCRGRRIACKVCTGTGVVPNAPKATREGK